MEDKTKSVYQNPTKNLIENVVRIESEDFLNYKPLFEDLINLVHFMNDNAEIKNKYLSEIRLKNKHHSNVNVTMQDIVINVEKYMEKFDAGVN